jgi:hypothetical protein
VQTRCTTLHALGSCAALQLRLRELRSSTFMRVRQSSTRQRRRWLTSGNLCTLEFAPSAAAGALPRQNATLPKVQRSEHAAQQGSRQLACCRQRISCRRSGAEQQASCRPPRRQRGCATRAASHDRRAAGCSFAAASALPLPLPPLQPRCSASASSSNGKARWNACAANRAAVRGAAHTLRWRRLIRRRAAGPAARA